MLLIGGSAVEQTSDVPGTVESNVWVGGGGSAYLEGTEIPEWEFVVIDPATGTIKGTIDQALQGSGWDDDWSDLGGGTLHAALDNADLSLLERGDVVRCFYRGQAAFQWVAGATDAEVIPADGSEGTVQWSGAGRMVALTGARIRPSRGFGSSPVEVSRSFGWPSVDYDDGSWGYESISLGEAGIPTPYWYGLADWPDPTAEWMWADGASTSWARTGNVYFRTTFTVAESKWYTINLACDDRGALWIDGQRIISTRDWDNSNNSIGTEKVALSAGEHTIAIWAQNNDGEVGNNPAGVLMSVMPEGGGQSIFSSGAGWKMLPYPLVAPGVSLGHALTEVLEESQAAGLLPGLSWSFTETVDSNGDPWDYLNDITANVGSSVWALIKAHVGADCQVHMPGGAYRLDLYRGDGGGTVRPITFDLPADEDDPTSGSVLSQRNRGEAVVATAAVVRYAGGWLEVDVTPDGAERVETYFEFQHVTDAGEAERTTRVELARLADVREEITLDIHPVEGELPWHHWFPGDTVTARDTAGDLVAEKVVGLSAVIDGDELRITPKIKDRILDEGERHEAWLKAMSDGASSGNTSATTPPVAPLPHTPPRQVEELTWSMPVWEPQTEAGRHTFRSRVTLRRLRIDLDAAATESHTVTLHLPTGTFALTISSGQSSAVRTLTGTIDNGGAAAITTTGDETFAGNVTLEYLTG